MPGAVCHTPTSRSASSNGSGLRRTPRTTLKMAVLAPMPSARVKMAISVNIGARSKRRATRTGVAVISCLYVYCPGSDLDFLVFHRFCGKRENRDLTPDPAGGDGQQVFEIDHLGGRLKTFLVYFQRFRGTRVAPCESPCSPCSPTFFRMSGSASGCCAEVRSSPRWRSCLSRWGSAAPPPCSLCSTRLFCAVSLWLSPTGSLSPSGIVQTRCRPGFRGPKPRAFATS